jgi:hypothetical protein
VQFALFFTRDVPSWFRVGCHVMRDPDQFKREENYAYKKLGYHSFVPLGDE